MSTQFDQFYNRVDSILSNGSVAKYGSADLRSLSDIKPSEYISGVTFDTRYDVQTNRAKISSLIGTSTVATGTFTLGTNTVLGGSDAKIKMLISNLTPTQPKNTNLFNMAIPFIAIYEGTGGAGANQVYPAWGTAEPADNFRFTGCFDYGAWNATPSQTSFTVFMFNNSGTTATFNYFVQFKYIQNNAGTST